MKTFIRIINEAIQASEYKFATPKTGMVAFAGDVNWKGIMVDSTPQKFLSLALPLPFSIGNQMEIDEVKNKMAAGIPIDPAVLIVDQGEVVGHEGRHRARAAIQLGITNFPILVIPRDYPRVPEWTPEQYAAVRSLNFKRETPDY